ncbi:uncharacterized protein zgc:193726 isoform X2 [Dicentrarchus labrax]|uniref:uncharacterized protein zgc:193726 isoform X2 n=1 Tax=Dicentrarchus labrax TaxID=13489 RepID=UPI0021F5445E|nr:uncharacterized protein zgc:193726 isoform X2 [Dicentrarchus labrax]
MMKPVALFLMMTMRMMMVSVSAGPLPPSLNDSRRDDQITVSPQLLVNKEENSTRFESRQSVNNSLEDFSRDSNRTTNETSPFIFILPLEKLETSEESEENLQQLNATDSDATQRIDDLFPLVGSAGRLGLAAPPACQLSICALMNLGHELQSGGDERAGRSSSDPFGHGK